MGAGLRECSGGRGPNGNSSGSAHLDAAAVEAVRQWRFAYAIQARTWVRVPVKFSLDSHTPTRPARRFQQNGTPRTGSSARLVQARLLAMGTISRLIR